MTLSDEEILQRQFMSLVSMLSENCMMMLGKLAPPDGSEPAIVLPGAQAMVALLEALQKRTEGNLSDREARWLEAQLTTCRLNYLEVQKAEGGEAPGDDAEGGDDPSGAAEAEGQAGAAEGDEDRPDD